MQVLQVHDDSGDETLSIWDAATGAQADVLPRTRAVICVAVCGEVQAIALGLHDGTVNAVDRVSKYVFIEDTEAHGRPAIYVSFSLTVRIWWQVHGTTWFVFGTVKNGQD